MINDGGVNDPIKSKMKFVFATDNPFGKEEKVMAGSLQMDDATMRDLRDEFHSGYIENNGAFDQSDRRFLRQQDIHKYNKTKQREAKERAALNNFMLAASAARAEASPTLSVVIPKKRGSDAMSPRDSMSPTSKRENAIVVVARKKKKKDKKKKSHKKKKKKKKRDDKPDAGATDSAANTTAPSKKPLEGATATSSCALLSAVYSSESESEDDE